MKRRRFIVLSVAGAAAAAVPFSRCGVEAPPESLSAILSKAQIKDIGKAYTDQYPLEKDKKKLAHLISITTNAVTEFQSGKTIIVHGWILSHTEARESALYFLNS